MPFESSHRFYKPSFSLHYHEIIRTDQSGTIWFATHQSDNGWMTYRGHDIALRPNKGELFSELPAGLARVHTSIHTTSVAQILRGMRTVSVGDTADTIVEVQRFACGCSHQINDDYRQTRDLVLEVFAAYVRFTRLIGPTTRKDQVNVTVMKAHAIYVARKLGLAIDAIGQR